MNEELYEDKKGQAEFYAVPPAILDSRVITDKEKVILVHVFGRLRGKGGWKKVCAPSFEELEELYQAGRMTMWRLRQKLEAAGIIRFEKRHDNSYLWHFLGFPDGWEERWTRRATALEKRAKGRRHSKAVSPEGTTEGVYRPETEVVSPQTEVVSPRDGGCIAPENLDRLVDSPTDSPDSSAQARNDAGETSFRGRAPRGEECGCAAPLAALTDAATPPKSPVTQFLLGFKASWREIYHTDYEGRTFDNGLQSKAQNISWYLEDDRLNRILTAIHLGWVDPRSVWQSTDYELTPWVLASDDVLRLAKEFEAMRLYVNTGEGDDGYDERLVYLWEAHPVEALECGVDMAAYRRRQEERRAAAMTVEERAEDAERERQNMARAAEMTANPDDPRWARLGWDEFWTARDRVQDATIGRALEEAWRADYNSRDKVIVAPKQSSAELDGDGLDDFERSLLAGIA